jgi:hypothetical protein
VLAPPVDLAAMLVLRVLNNGMINGTVLRLDGGYHR